MAKKTFDKIAEGLNEALLIARGEAKPAKLHVPPELHVKSIRKKTGLSQDSFASTFGFTLEQIKSWEQGRSRPLGGVRAYLMLIDLDHGSVEQILRSAKRTRAA